jgi:hypothetical protein
MQPIAFRRRGGGIKRYPNYNEPTIAAYRTSTANQYGEPARSEPFGQNGVLKRRDGVLRRRALLQSDTKPHAVLHASFAYDVFSITSG